MANLREIRNRISGVRSTSKITQAMKLVAAVKLRRSQEAILAARPYAKSLYGLMSHLLGRVDRTLLPLMMDREVKDAVLLVIVTADRGLCGPFNTNIIRATTHRIETEYKEKQEQGKLFLICIGRRGYQYFSKRGYNILNQHLGIIGSAKFMDAQKILSEMLEGYMDKTFDHVEVIYNEFKSVIQQNLRHEQLLPIPAEPAIEIEVDGHKYHQFIDYIYEPSEIDIMNYLIPKHLNFQMYRILLESNAAEQGARMTAMDSATTNAKELINTLLLQYNSARQASITKELLEIVSGAEALKNG